MATRSTANVIVTTGWVRRKRSPSRTLADPALVPPPSGAQRRQPEDRDERGGEAEGVDPVRDPEPWPGDQQPGDERSDGRGEGRAGIAERARGGQVLHRYEPRNDRGARGAVHARQQRLHRGEDVQQSDRMQVRHRLDDEQPGRRRESRRGEHRELAAVHRVGDGAAVEPADQQRHERHQPEQADRERTPGDREDLNRQRHHRQLGARLRDDLADQQPPVGRRAPRRAEVGQDLGVPGAFGELRRLGCQGPSLSLIHSCATPRLECWPVTRRKRTRSCSRSGRPCQNSTCSGVSR